MAIHIGSQLGPYQVTSLIGKGGMGEVYRAHDTKLKRDVALKVLPDAFARDTERVARFRREAQVLAALNHPNIAAIYGLEESAETALAMELVEGETLSGPLPVETALNYARQIADALEAAHDKGIIHRDLKPANVKVTPAGVVKVLDFGLAAIADPARAGSADPNNSPTLTMSVTQAGMILGTAAYMSPEQAAGKQVDKRSDIWSYGVVLFEMLTGSRLFEGGETISHTLADVLRAPIDLDKLPAGTPAAIRNLLRRCLDRDVKNRLRDIGEARIAIDNAGKSSEGATRTTGGRRAYSLVRRVGIVAMATLAITALWGWWQATRPVQHPPMRFSDDLGAEVLLTSSEGPAIAISADGLRIAYVSRASDGRSYLYLRQLANSKSVMLAGSEGGAAPFFSPDGRWIAFFSDQKLKKISVEGGAAVTLCDVGAAPRGGFWGEDGNILFSNQRTPLMRVSSSGGKPAPATELNKGEVTNRLAQLLPGGEAFLFTASQDNNVWEDATIQVQTIKTGTRKTLVQAGYFGRYVSTSDGAGYLLYVHHNTIFAAPMNLKRLELTGPASPVLENVAGRASNGFAQFDVTPAGNLIYVAGSNTTIRWSLLWVDSSGNTKALPAGPALYQNPRLSPDGARIAVKITDGAGTNLSVYDWATNRMTRLTFKSIVANSPVWAPDGKHIAFYNGSNDLSGPGIYWIRADGAVEAQRLLESSNVAPYSFSPDGKRLAYSNQNVEFGVWTLPLDLTDADHPKPGKPERFLPSKSLVLMPAFSPDGRWIAYASAETEPAQIFVRPFPLSSSGGKWQISADGGQAPIWARNGRELLFMAPGVGPRVVSYSAKGDSFVADPPRLWSEKWPTVQGSPDLAPDGRFLTVMSASEISPERQTHVTFLLNFADQLKRLAPEAK